MNTELTTHLLSLPISERKEILDNVLRNKKILHDEMNEANDALIEQFQFLRSIGVKTKRGRLIQAPCGSGKSTWIQQTLHHACANRPESGPTPVFLDGDEVLAKEGIKNRNYFWYQEGREAQKVQNSIRSIFNMYLSQGYNILYSGNPYLLTTDVIVMPDASTRWQQLQKRQQEGGFGSSPDKFKLEEETYQRYILEHPDIPVFTSFHDLLK